MKSEKRLLLVTAIGGGHSHRTGGPVRRGGHAQQRVQSRAICPTRVAPMQADARRHRLWRRCGRRRWGWRGGGGRRWRWRRWRGIRWGGIHQAHAVKGRAAPMRHAPTCLTCIQSGNALEKGKCGNMKLSWQAEAYRKQNRLAEFGSSYGDVTKVIAVRFRSNQDPDLGGHATSRVKDTSNQWFQRQRLSSSRSNASLKVFFFIICRLLFL